MQSWIDGETAPRQFVIYDSSDLPQNLTGCTVELELTGNDGVAIDTTGAVAVTTPASGLITYSPTIAQISAALSPLLAMFVVTDSLGNVGYFPGEGADEWHVYPARTSFPRHTFEDLRKQVLRWLDAIEEYGTASTLDEFVKQQLNEANADRSTEYGWPFMRADYELAVTGASRRYSIPGNIARLLYVWSPTDRKMLTRIPDRHLDDAGVSFDGTDTSSLYQPYEIRDRSIIFFEPPANSETLRLGYFKTPAKMLNAEDLPNLPYPHSRLLVWDALLDLKSYANELSGIPLWAKKQQDALTKLYAAHVDGQTLGEMPLSIKPGTENF